MKRPLLILMAAIGMTTASFGQTKSSGIVQLRAGYTVQIDLDKTSNLATFTLVGPLNNWLSIGLNDVEMGTGDCVSYNSQLHDQHFMGGHIQPAPDTTNNLTLISATNDGVNKTIIFKRPLNTGDSKDYSFNYDTLSSLNIIWCEGSMTYQQHLGSTYKGTKTISFELLGTKEFVSPLEQTLIYPNPSNGIFKLIKSSGTQILKIKIFDVSAKLLMEINSDPNNSEIQIDMTGVSKGIYFVELNSDNDKAVKKIQIN